MNIEFQLNGLPYLLNELKREDLLYYNKVDKGNPLRVIRALEVIRSTGSTYSSFLDKNKISKRNFDVLKFVIDLPRTILYERINFRVEQMISIGLLDEVKSVFEFRHLQSLNTVGYKEFFSYLKSEIEFEEAIELIKKNTRNYAKRQLTWFRKDTSTVWLKSSDTESQLNEVISVLNEFTLSF